MARGRLLESDDGDDFTGTGQFEAFPAIAHHAVDVADALGTLDGGVRDRVARPQLAGVDADVDQIAVLFADRLESQRGEWLAGLRLALDALLRLGMEA